MKTVTITEAKNKFSALIDGLKAGSPVLIVDGGRPVARLEAVTRIEEPEQDGRLSRLAREGLVRPPAAPWPKALLDATPLSAKRGVSAVTVLLQERRDGR